MTREEIVAQITTLLGGRAAEIVQFGEVTTGSANDIERATALARGMVTQYGMSERFGPMCLERPESRYLDGGSVKGFSGETDALIQDEVRQILADCQTRAIELLNGSRASLDRIADYLLEKENISGAAFMELLASDAKVA